MPSPVFNRTPALPQDHEEPRPGETSADACRRSLVALAADSWDVPQLLASSPDRAGLYATVMRHPSAVWNRVELGMWADSLLEDKQYQVNIGQELAAHLERSCRDVVCTTPNAPTTIAPQLIKDLVEFPLAVPVTSKDDPQRRGRIVYGWPDGCVVDWSETGGTPTWETEDRIFQHDFVPKSAADIARHRHHIEIGTEVTPHPEHPLAGKITGPVSHVYMGWDGVRAREVVTVDIGADRAWRSTRFGWSNLPIDEVRPVHHDAPPPWSRIAARVVADDAGVRALIDRQLSDPQAAGQQELREAVRERATLLLNAEISQRDAQRATEALLTEATTARAAAVAQRLFIGVYPGGLVYADRERDEHGDYKRCGFLDYQTLRLEIAKDCPKELASAIQADAARMQAMRGQTFPLAATGNASVVLGSADTTTSEINAAGTVRAAKSHAAATPTRLKYSDVEDLPSDHPLVAQFKAQEDALDRNYAAAGGAHGGNDEESLDYFNRYIAGDR